MRISLNLLRTFISCDWPYDKIAERLTMSGTEVKAVELRGRDISGVITARVVSRAPLEDSDKLSLCQVDTGKERLQVVCGAPDVAEGQVVLFAPIGSTLPGGVRIEQAVLHGQESFGMILSEAELHLSPESDLISVLPEKTKVGIPLDRLIDYEDVIFELEITPNRPDCLSHLGIARELQALGGGKLRLQSVEIDEIAEPTSEKLKISIDDPGGCPRYTGRLIRDVNVEPSPLKLKAMIHYLGMRPINNVVDITNFVMLELGHPLHAFDFNLFRRPEVVVRRARQGERFVTLDKTERTLNGEHLLITDGVSGVAIAGIMGGLDSEVTEKTSAILLESAYFDPLVIRKGSKNLGLQSESSRRFERGADPNLAPLANDRACKMIAEICGGSVLRGIVDCHPRPFVPVTIELRPSRVGHLLGLKVAKGRIRKILKDLEIPNTIDGNIVAGQPSFRADLTREVDLIEEIARIYGFDNIPAAFKPGGSLETPETSIQRFRETIRSFLVGAGATEIFPLTLADSGLAGKLGLLESSVRLMNPISEEMAIVRPNLIITLLPVLRRNINFRETDLTLFEIGDVYRLEGPGILPTQRARLALAICGKEFPDFWEGKWRARDLFSLKGLLQDLAEHLHAGEVTLKPAPYFAFEKAYSFEVYFNQRPLGHMGRLSEAVAEAADIKIPAFIAELDFEWLAELAPDSIAARELPRYPSADRDIAIVIDDAIPAAEVQGEIERAAGGLVSQVRVFDLYKGKNVPSGKKSLAFGIRYRLPDRTLTDEEVNRAQERILESLRARFGAELRQ